jgi:4-hydroxy-4-methyl-2-oxoglutarate aldolase
MKLTLMAKGKTVHGLEALRQFDACTLSNAIERFRVRPRNEGFISGGVVCRFPHNRPVVGHAVTGRIQTYMPPVTGKCYYDHIEWWRYLLTIPPPRVVVLYDMDHRPGFGAIFGEIHAHLCQALECEAFLTNGSVRDLQAIEPLGIQLFSGSVSVSHAYAHVVDFGEPVEIGGLGIKPGDILFGDRHGVISIPPDLVKALPLAVAEIQSEEKELIDLTKSPNFSVEILGDTLRQFAERHRCS